MDNDTEYGVLLYYKFAAIPDLDKLYSFYDTNCRSLSLLGRVRLSSKGVNVTVGGKLSALEKHIAEVSSNSLFEGTDFKLASCRQPANDRVAEECGFTSLSIRIVQELVTFSAHPLLKSPEVSNAGKHLSASEFHSVLQHAGNSLGRDCEDDCRKVVLLDARNLYETRIGKFETPNVETLDPEVRQYSDLHSWIDDNSEQLRGNQILMYCTGGIRCEMASAYIKSKGDGFENVYQLFGGIQRYLEQFPDGGFFKGKNFVFDHRVSVGSSSTKIIGNCLLCSCPFDDYSSRSRCIHCRMLVLICNSCQEKGSAYICELCEKNGKIIGSIQSIKKDDLEELPIVDNLTIDSLSCQLSPSLGTRPLRKLRILCLHGFRQNASSFKGRTASLAKKLKNIAELVFINAPHELPFIYQPPPVNPTDCPPPLIHESDLPPKSCSKRFAWFTAPGISKDGSPDWQMADCPFDPLQYQHQTDGYDISLENIQNFVQQEGPFDGILGFSQGAAMVALVCAQQRIHNLKIQMNFRFAILCSGFTPESANCEKGSINCPSLHILGNMEGKDRQIANQASRELSSLFDSGCSKIIEHEFGHIIPTRSPYIDEIKEFLLRFL